MLITYPVTFKSFDPLGQPTVMAGRDHCFCTCRPFVRPSVRSHFSKQNKFQAKTMVSTGETVGLAEWIIDDSCFYYFCAQWYDVSIIYVSQILAYRLKCFVIRKLKLVENCHLTFKAFKFISSRRCRYFYRMTF